MHRLHKEEHEMATSHISRIDSTRVSGSSTEEVLLTSLPHQTEIGTTANKLIKTARIAPVEKVFAAKSLKRLR